MPMTSRKPLVHLPPEPPDIAIFTIVIDVEELGGTVLVFVKEILKLVMKVRETVNNEAGSCLFINICEFKIGPERGVTHIILIHEFTRHRLLGNRVPPCRANIRPSGQHGAIPLRIRIRKSYTEDLWTWCATIGSN